MRIAKKYELVGLLGKGKFGAVYQGKNVKTGELVAIKLEKMDQVRVLKHETAILNYLYSKSCRNIPLVHMYGIIDSYAYLAMPLYEETFDTFVQSSPNIRNTLSTCMSSAIRILGNVHKQGVVHRDIKPDNWMIHETKLILIDFGLATFYIDDAGRHIPFSQKRHIVGTPKYASIRVHEGAEYSRRDDLISLAYIGLSIAVYPCRDLWGLSFIESSLDISSPGNSNLVQAKQLSQLLPRIQLEFPGLAKYFEKVYSLDFDEKPDYDQLSDIFSKENDINDLNVGNV
jgi:serine/threonine protein kinase